VNTGCVIKTFQKKNLIAYSVFAHGTLIAAQEMYPIIVLGVVCHTTKIAMI
jgi:hypothetical protein